MQRLIWHFMRLPAFALLIAGAPALAKASGVDCSAIYQTPEHGKSFYEQNPTYADPRDDTADWSFSDPAREGLNQQMLEKGAQELAKSKRSFSLVVLKNGKLVFERYFNDSTPQASNNIHSASKSMISTMIGIAIDRGYIKSVDQKVEEFLPEYFADIEDDRVRSLTIRHLLTMSSGYAWKDDPVVGTEYEIQQKPDWVKAIVSLPLAKPPGKKFFYNTGLTHLLSAIVARASGMNTCEFGHRYLFDPMGVTVEHWGMDPQGVYSGGYNLYLTPREMAKFGQMILDGGQYKNRQIVSTAWIKEAVTPRYGADEGFGTGWTYGYNWWIHQINGHPMVIGWGYGGQMIYIIPEIDAVVVLTRDTSDAVAVSNDPVNHDFVSKYVVPRK